MNYDIFERDNKYYEDLERSNYLREFEGKYHLVFDIISYFVKFDDKFTSKEKDIVKQYFRDIESNNEYLTDENFEYFFRKFFKKISYQTYQSRVRKFCNNVKHNEKLINVFYDILLVNKQIELNKALEYFIEIVDSKK